MAPQYRRRHAVLAVAGALHVLVFELMIHAPLMERIPEQESTIWSTLTLLPPELPKSPPPHKRIPRPRTTRPAPATESLAPANSEPISATPDQNGPGHAVDWMSELDKASKDVATKAAATSGPSHAEPPTPDSWWPAPVHKAGDQYTLRTGEKIYWVSANCFLISDPPPAGTPNALAHSQLARNGCVKSPTPGGELFKDLPAYKKRHPEDPP